MDLDLKAFSLTLAVGLAFTGVLCAALWVVRSPRVGKVFRLFGEKENSVLLSVMSAVIMLAVGLVCEDLSKNAIDKRNPAALAPQFAAILPSETTERCLALLKGEREPRVSCASAETEASSGPSDILVPVQEVAIGSWNMLERLVHQGLATTEEVRVWQELQQDFVLSRCPKDFTKLEDPEDSECIRYNMRTPERIEQLYYLAKNTAYASPNFFRELEAIRLRYNFERSIAFVLLLGIFIVSFVYLVRSTQNMWRDVGGWKTAISMILAFLLVVGLADVVVWPKWPIPTAVVSYCGTVLTASEDICKSSGKSARDWLLPAMLVFVCLYRLRRAVPRAWAWIARAVVSTIPGPPLVRSDREIQAARALGVALVLGAAILPVYWAYRADQNNYLMRVFAYYESIRGPALACHYDESLRGITCERAPSIRTPSEEGGGTDADDH